MGALARGQVGIVAGWSGSVQMVTDEPVIDSKGRTWTTCHVVPEKWVVDSNAQQSGGAYRWLKDILFEGLDDGQAYAEMDRLAQDVPPGAGGSLAFIGPMVMDMTRMRISLGGFIFPVTPSVTDVKRGHLVRAALENVAFAFKGNCAQLEEITRLRIRDVSIGGGLAQSQCLIRILPSVLGMPVTAFEVPNVTSWGTAMCAAVGAGVYPNLEQASEAMRPKSKVVEPDAEAAEAYATYYQKWLTIARWLDDLGQTIG